MPAVTQEEDSMLHRAERMLVQGRCKMTGLWLTLDQDTHKNLLRYCFKIAICTGEDIICVFQCFRIQ